MEILVKIDSGQNPQSTYILLKTLNNSFLEIRFVQNFANILQPIPGDPYIVNRTKSQSKQPVTRLFAKREKDVRQYLGMISNKMSITTKIWEPLFSLECL